MIKVNHPGSFTSYGPKKSSITVTMDNGCNFAFALAGIEEFNEAYFTENHCVSNLVRVSSLIIFADASSPARLDAVEDC